MYTDDMTARRFRDIIEAYGANAARWPDEERDAALEFLAAHADEAGPWLDEVRALDELMDVDNAHASLVPERLHYQTVARMIAANDVGGTMPERRMPMVWAAGLGLVACLAGALFGVNVSLKGLDEVRAEAVLEQAQMIDTENG